MIALALLLACSPSSAPEVLDVRAGEAPVEHPDDRQETGADTAAVCDWTELNKIEALEAIIDGVSDDCQVGWYLDVLATLESEPHEGPWFENLWVMETEDATSFDVAGSTFIRAGGAVPEAVLGPDGKTYLFYVEGDLDRARTNALARSGWFRDHGLTGYGSFDALVSDDGLNFSPLVDFRVEGIVRGMVADPDIIQLPDGRWRMYYVGLPVTDLDASGVLGLVTPSTAYYAESDDLVTWRQVGVAADGPDADPTVHCFEDLRCVMVSTGLDWSSSEDAGGTFDFDDTDSPGGFAPELVEVADGTLRLLYNSKVVGGAVDSMLSEDEGLSWTYEGERISDCLVEAVSMVAKPEGGWMVYYHYWQNGWSGSDFGERAGDPDYPDPCDEVVDPREDVETD